MRKIISLLLVLLAVLPVISACKKKDSNVAAATTTEIKSALSYEIPETEVTESPNGTTRLVYAVNNTDAGTIVGRTSQSLAAGRTSAEVTATPNPGYKFIQWSDGSENPTRKGETGKEGYTTKYYAVFAPDPLDMPMIFIETETGEDVTSKTEYIGGSISVANCANGYIINDLDMEIRGRGNYSWGLDKKSYRIKLSEQQQLLGLGEGRSKSWVLLANHCDQSLIRNYVAHTFASKMSGIAYAPDCTNVEVYVNGKYNGVYLLCEPITVNKNRVNISEEVESGTDIGYLVQLSEYAEDHVFRVGRKEYEIKSDLSTDPTTAQAQRQYIQTFMNQCWAAVESGDRATIEAYIDLNSVIDTYIVEETVKNIDVGWDSFYFYKDAGGKLFFGPIWDFDLAMGNANEGTETYVDLLAAQDHMDQSNPWYYTLMNYDWFRQLVAERWKSDEVQGIVKTLPDLVTNTAEDSYDSFCRNFEAWDIFGEALNRESEYIIALSNYKEHYQYLAGWVKNRINWMNEFIGSSEYNNGETRGGSNSAVPPPPQPDRSVLNCSGGSGTKADPYLISTAKDFSSLTKAVLAGEPFEDKYFKQTANLNMTTVRTYRGMGKSGSFGGIYDGCGYTIYAELSGEDQCIFPYLTGLVMNLVTEGSVHNNGQAAGICRSIRNTGAVINCASAMTLSSDNSMAAGIAASTNGDTPILFNCVFAGSHDESNDTSPSTGWYEDRDGAFGYLYHPDSMITSNSSAAYDIALPTESMENGLAAELNSHLAEAAQMASKYGITEADLCKWEDAPVYPLMLKK